MSSPRLLSLATLGALVMLATGASAQLGKTYTNTQHGFEIKPLEDWASIPPEPGEKYMVVKFVSNREHVARTKPVKHSPSMTIDAYYKRAVTGEQSDEFENLPDEIRKKLEEAGVGGSYQTFADFYEARLKSAEVVKKPKERKINKIPTVEYNYVVAGTMVPLQYRTYVYQGDAMEVAVTFSAMEEWFKDVDRDFERCARTFKWAERVTESTEGLGEQEAFLKKQIDALPPGWSWLESQKERYLFLYDAEEKFVKELDRLLEAMRDHYETAFPPPKPITAVSIVRVCSSYDTYQSYGGPPGSGGYWSSGRKELVIFDNKLQDRNLTLAVIKHEAFHQYIYYYGDLSPHIWYNEGHADYFAGAKISASGRKVQKIERLNVGATPRYDRIKQAVREENWIPLKEFFTWSQAQYYSGDALKHYAQGWSVVYFLREDRRGRKWLPKLDEYLENLMTARDALVEKGTPELQIEGEAQSQAHEATFGSWSDEEWEELQAAWLSAYGG